MVPRPITILVMVCLVVFRFYGPLEGYIEKTRVLNDFEEVQ